MTPTAARTLQGMIPGMLDETAATLEKKAGLVGA